MEVYFDNSATTCCTKDVVDVVTKAMMEDYGNPSSRHLKGVEAEMLLRGARQTIADTLRCQEKEIFFTSGGTESDNWALIGAAMAHKRKGMHLITTSVEHAAILRSMQYLEEQGFRVTYLPVDHRGHISLDDLKAALCEETILVSIMHVNNEVGAVQPVAEATAIVKAYNPEILVHTDAVQSYGKIPTNVRKLGVDMLSVSGHKIHAPKGTGFLYVKDKVRILPLILGGGQQKGMRSGTDNVPGALGLAQAAKNAAAELETNRAHFISLRDRLVSGLRELENVTVHSGTDEISAPHIVSAAFTGVRSEVMLHALEDRGIYVSAGSACSSNKKLPVSPVLEQLKMPREQMEATLRFSFGKFNTAEEVDYTLQTLKEYLPVLRKYTRK